MGMTDVGRRQMLDLALAANSRHYGVANAYLAVGTGVTAFAASQTTLVTAEVREIASDAGSGVRATDTLTWVASYETGDANQAWNEEGVYNQAATGELLARRNDALGTKASGTWTLTYTLAVT